MANVRIVYVLPTTRVDGSPLPVDQIDYVRIEARTNQFPFQEIARVPATETSLRVPDLAPGKWDFRGTVVDDKDEDGASRESDPALASSALAAARPSPLASFSATVE